MSKKPKCKVDWKPRKAYRFEDWEIEYLKKHWETKTGYEIAAHLHRHPSSVYGKGKQIFSKVKTKVFRAKKTNPAAFKKGHVPWNKGKKGLQTPVTKFKKGHIPWHTKPIGSITKRKGGSGVYNFIKIDEHQWELLHHIIWKKHHGEIPKGHIVRFKDGNRDNVDISNLECISKGKHGERNLCHEKQKHAAAFKREGGFLHAILNGYIYEK